MTFDFKKIVAFTIILTVGPKTLSQGLKPLSDYDGCEYVTPVQLQEANKGLAEAEKGMFTTVPLDYKDPSSGTTQVYSYFASGFDPNRPTFALFTGGPGQSSHLQLSPKFHFYETLGYNFLLFDQRGIAFSRLADEKIARDARNFSSEATARDLLTIIDRLGIKKISVYGASYGTVPATIFASLFSQRTTALVLEGVIYDGWNGIMGGRSVMELVQKFYDDFDPALKDKLDELIAAKKISESWLPTMTRGFLMQYGEIQLPLFKQAIQQAFLNRKLESEKDVGTIYQELASKQATASLTETEQQRSIKWYKLMEHENKCREITDSNDLNHLLMLKEFDAGLDHVTSMYVLKNRKIVAVPGVNYSPLRGKFTNLESSSYSASKYPVKVPTFYLQGTADGATPAPGAFMHYKNAAVGPAQILLFKGSGHMPIGLSILGMDRAEDQWQDLQKAFAGILAGKPVACETKSLLEKKYPNINLAIATKGFSKEAKCHF